MKLYMNANIIHTHIFNKLMNDLKVNLRSHKATFDLIIAFFLRYLFYLKSYLIETFYE